MSKTSLLLPTNDRQDADTTNGNQAMTYEPQPIDTSDQQLLPEIEILIERLAAHTHDIWAIQKIADGWGHGAIQSDKLKQHPALVPYEELDEGVKEYDRKISAETLKAILAMGFHITPRPPLFPVVNWLQRALNQVQDQRFKPVWDRELAQCFAGSEFDAITVSDVFRGYSVDEQRQIVLGIQLHGQKRVSSHVVKLGDVTKVERDFRGWTERVLKYGFTSRVLVGMRGMRLPKKRFAAIYEDAYRLFGTDSDMESPKTLEVAADWSISDSKPDIQSLERIVRQIFGELNRCLYRGGHEDANVALEFYAAELHKQEHDSAWHRWLADPTYQTLRRDATWLLTGHVKPNTEELPFYLDPFDYVRWALENNQVPATLIGRAHGDLHGRNVLVGVVRGEVEQPAIFDYGDMVDSPVPVWDFAKLEVELKSRLLPKLHQDPMAHEALAKWATASAQSQPKSTLKAAPLADESIHRADRLAFAFHFERVLALLTERLISREASDTLLTCGDRTITGHASLDKALCLCYRIRQEAAYHLGYSIGRSDQWRDEFYFALAVYGLLKAKWKVERPQLEWSLISAGVATAQLTGVDHIRAMRREDPPRAFTNKNLPSHLVPLAWVHAHWQRKQNAAGARMAQLALQYFPSGVTLKSECALCLAASGDVLAASNEIEPLRKLCHVFRDHEMLCRFGRIFKDLGDKEWEADTAAPSYESFVSGKRHPAWALYNEAFKLYREAFELSDGHYYPGINAATLALLTGSKEDQLHFAARVLRSCCDASLVDSEERFWACATEGEAALLCENSAEAVQFYRAAFAVPLPSRIGMLQAMYNQLCRLAWALGTPAVVPVVQLMKERGLLKGLEPGPFGNCQLFGEEA